MSIYPPPVNSNIFNEINFNDLDDNSNSNNNNDDNINLDNYVKKTGDTITGKLIVPEIEYYDLSKQSTAFTNDIKNDVINSKLKLTNFEYNNNYSVINKIKTTELKINNVLTEPFQTVDKTKIYENEGNIINHNSRIIALENVNHIDDDSNYVEKNTELLNIPSITFNDGSVQTHAFQDEDILQLASNKQWISDLLLKTRNISYNDDNSYTTITRLKTDNDFMINNEKYSDKMASLDSKNLHQDIDITDNRIDIDRNITSIVNLRNDVDAINASNYDSELYQHNNRITSNLNAINSINSKLNNKINIGFNFGWEALGNPNFQPGGITYISDFIYRITDHSSLSSYTIQANGNAPRFFSPDLANKKLLFKYSINFTSGGADLKKFKSRYNIYNNISNEGSASLVNFSNYHGNDYIQHYNFNNIIMYRDSFVVNLNGNNETVALFTEWDFKTQFALYMYGKIQIIEI